MKTLPSAVKVLSLVSALLVLGGGGWFCSRFAGEKTAIKQAGQPKRLVVKATPTPSPQAKQPQLAVSAKPMPVKATPEPPRHVAPAGTVTKDELFSAIKKDARVYGGVWMWSDPVFSSRVMS